MDIEHNDAEQPKQVDLTDVEQVEANKPKRGRKPNQPKQVDLTAVEVAPQVTNTQKTVSEKTNPDCLRVTNFGHDFYESQTATMLKAGIETTLACDHVKRAVILKNINQLNDLAGYGRFVVGD